MDWRCRELADPRSLAQLAELGFEPSAGLIAELGALGIGEWFFGSLTSAFVHQR